MTNLEWAGVVLTASLAAAAISTLATSMRLNRRIRDYESIEKAVEGAQLRMAEEEEALANTARALSQRQEELDAVEERTRHLVALKSRENELGEAVEAGTRRRDELQLEIEGLISDWESRSDSLHDLMGQVDLYTRVLDFIDFGMFEEPEYLHDASERYKIEIKAVRDEQKALIKDSRAVELPPDIEVDGSSKKAKNVLAGQTKLILRAFNIECDLLFEKLNPSNFDRTLERIEKIAENLEKLSISLMIGITDEYIKLKFHECKLTYEFKLRRANEREEQRLIREQIREEQKAAREYEAAIAESEREEQRFQKALTKAREELAAAEDAAKAELSARIALLEEQLAEAHEKGERAKSLAEQTRRGHVYIISNIGSFGDGIYKIGLTRRLDPLDRVKELGDASVPFTFDVHAIIYNDDSPSLEAELHRRFNHRRVNAVNQRKEFFVVDLQEIKTAVEDICGQEAEFTMTAVAEEYFESLRLQGRAESAA